MYKMKKEVINGPGLAQPSAPVSLAVRAGGFVYTCGQMPTDPHTGEPVEGTIEDKARATLENIRLVLESAGGRLADVVKVMVYTTDLKYMPDFNKVYREYFPSDYPARSGVQVVRLADDLEFEVEAIAYIGDR